MKFMVSPLSFIYFQLLLNSDSDSVPSKTGLPNPIPFPAENNFRFRFRFCFWHKNCYFRFQFRFPLKTCSESITFCDARWLIHRNTFWVEMAKGRRSLMKYTGFQNCAKRVTERKREHSWVRKIFTLFVGVSFIRSTSYQIINFIKTYHSLNSQLIWQECMIFGDRTSSM